MQRESLIKELFKRRVPQIIGSYFLAGVTAIFFIDWLISRYNLPDYYVSLCLFGLVSIIPTVIVISYFHGAPGKDEWTIIEKTIIPINIMFIIVSLLFGYKYEIWLYGFENAEKNFIIHLSSNKKYIDYYYGDDYDYFDKENYLITAVKEPLLDSLQNSIVAQLNEHFFSAGIIIESTTSQKIKNKFDQLPYYRSPYNQDSEHKIKIISEKLKREIYANYNFETENEMIVYIYQVYDKREEQGRLGYFFDIAFMEKFQLTSNLFARDTYYNKKDLIKAVGVKLGGTIYSTSIGDKNIGRIIEILAKDIVKIKLDNIVTLKKGMTLVSPAKYYWKRDGLERRVEDYELAMDYINRHPKYLEQNDNNGLTVKEKKEFYGDGSLFQKDYLWALTEISRGEKMDIRRGTALFNNIYYVLKILDVNKEWETFVAKVILKNPAWVKVRKGDKIYINGAFGIQQ